MNRFQELAELYQAHAARAQQQDALYQQQVQGLKQAYNGLKQAPFAKQLAQTTDWQDLYKKLLEVVNPDVKDAMQGKAGTTIKVRLPSNFTVVDRNQLPDDPDGSLVPLPTKPAFVRTITAPTHDYLAALRRPYEPIA